MAHYTAECLCSSCLQILVLPLSARADERSLAELLHTKRSRVKLAPAGSLVQLCGYSVGSVPPFGHRRRLPVIVDSAVTAYAACYAGGGSEDAELAMSVQELVRAAGATVADISLTSSAAAKHSGSAAWHVVHSGGSGPADAGAGGDGDAPRGGGAVAVAVAGAQAAALPEPWQAGEVDVTIEGLIAQRRKIAKVLLFANLVPLDAAAGSGGAASSGTNGSTGSKDPSSGGTGSTTRAGSATFLRRLWRHPESGEACEVQLILGRTVEHALGRWVGWVWLPGQHPSRWRLVHLTVSSLLSGRLQAAI